MSIDEFGQYRRKNRKLGPSTVQSGNHRSFYSYIARIFQPQDGREVVRLILFILNWAIVFFVIINVLLLSRSLFTFGANFLASVMILFMGIGSHYLFVELIPVSSGIFSFFVSIILCIILLFMFVVLIFTFPGKDSPTPTVLKKPSKFIPTQYEELPMDSTLYYCIDKTSLYTLGSIDNKLNFERYLSEGDSIWVTASHWFYYKVNLEDKVLYCHEEKIIPLTDSIRQKIRDYEEARRQHSRLMIYFRQ